MWLIAKLPWLGRDSRLLIAASSIRAFGQGFVSVTLAIYLAKIGLDLVQIGAFFSVGAAGAASFALALTFVSERLGRKRLLVGLTLLSALTFMALIVTNNVIVLGLFAFVGALGAGSGGGLGATQPLVRASLAEAADPVRRTDTFAFYRIMNTLARAFGALAAGLPALLASHFALNEVAAFKIVLAGLTALLIVVALLFAGLSTATAAPVRDDWTNPFKLPSRRTIFVLTGLFGMDSLGGALLIQSLVAYWFYARFGLQLGALSLVFFASALLTASSMWFAAKLANRIGLLNTMVFTHIPSSLLLICAAFSPFAWLAIAFWQVRAFFIQMDVPTRDSYTMAIVGREERIAMASLQQLSTSAASTAGPSIGTALWVGISASAPFVASAVLKIAYDLTLWKMFRNVRTPEETARLARRHRSQVAEISNPPRNQSSTC